MLKDSSKRWASDIDSSESKANQREVHSTAEACK